MCQTMMEIDKCGNWDEYYGARVTHAQIRKFYFHFY